MMASRIGKYRCWQHCLAGFLVMIYIGQEIASTRTIPIALARTRRRQQNDVPLIPSNKKWIAAQRTISVFDPKVRSVFYGDDDHDDDRHGQDPDEENATPTPTKKPTVYPSISPSLSHKPTAFPSLSTKNPSQKPTSELVTKITLPPSGNLSKHPSVSPSRSPSRYPTYIPTPTSTSSPSPFPTLIPSELPSVSPTKKPSARPSSRPSWNPTKNPSKNPSRRPSVSPTIFPSSNPTDDSSTHPTSYPTTSPSETPTKYPSKNPSRVPTISPTIFPSSNPTDDSSTHPTSYPTTSPSETPTKYPSRSPSRIPTISPTTFPSSNPTDDSSTHPSLHPTTSPSRAVTMQPSENPSQISTISPTTFPSSDPTDGPSTHPTSNPTTSPTVNSSPVPSQGPTFLSSFSSQPTCEEIATTGKFGDTSFEPVILNYAYNMETDAFSNASMNDEIIPVLELTMVQFVIANTMLESGCISEERRLQTIHRKLENMVGISSLPTDKSLPQGCPNSEDDTKCTSIEGRMSLYITKKSRVLFTGLRNSEPGEEMESVVMDTIKMGMEEDKFLNAHSSIRKVIFVGKIDTNVFPFDDDNQPRGIDPEPRGFERDDILTAGIFIGIIALVALILLSITVARRRLERRRVGSEAGSWSIDESGSDHGVLGSEVDDDDLKYQEPWTRVDLDDDHTSNPHDESTVRIANRGGGGGTRGSGDFPVGEDIDSRGRNSNRDALFDFFDLILENSIETGDPSGSRPRSLEFQHDELSEISF